jgi:hypothetical protein
MSYGVWAQLEIWPSLTIFDLIRVHTYVGARDRRFRRRLEEFRLFSNFVFRFPEPTREG